VQRARDGGTYVYGDANSRAAGNGDCGAAHRDGYADCDAITHGHNGAANVHARADGYGDAVSHAVRDGHGGIAVCGDRGVDGYGAGVSAWRRHAGALSTRAGLGLGV